MKNEPPRQLKTVPLTTEHLNRARAGAAQNANPSSSPMLAAASAAHAGPVSSVGAMTAAPAATGKHAPAKRSSSRGAMLTIAGLAFLGLACAGAAWTSHKKQL